MQLRSPDRLPHPHRFPRRHVADNGGFVLDLLEDPGLFDSRKSNPEIISKRAMLTSPHLTLMRCGKAYPGLLRLGHRPTYLWGHRSIAINAVEKALLLLSI